jgi:hypothetical protein
VGDARQTAASSRSHERRITLWRILNYGQKLKSKMGLTRMILLSGKCLQITLKRSLRYWLLNSSSLTLGGLLD